jgi:hypothetical protein
MTKRLTFQDDKEGSGAQENTALRGFKEYDSLHNPPDYSSSDADSGADIHRISQLHLDEIYTRLSERDKEVLSSIRQCRYLSSRQIQRLHFTESANPAAALRAASRSLKKLKELGLIDSLTRRIGGVRAGSGSLIWYLTATGERLLRLHSSETYPRHRRFFEPSPYFLAHTLAASECYIRLTETCGKGKLKLVAAELEPRSWRSYNHKGKIAHLKPDLCAVTNFDEYEDHWFFEIDLATEAPVKILEKCDRYHQYYRSGLEQKQHGVFPLVVWIVPDTARKESIGAHIRVASAHLPHIFVVITIDELAALLLQGIETKQLC